MGIWKKKKKKKKKWEKDARSFLACEWRILIILGLLRGFFLFCTMERPRSTRKLFLFFSKKCLRQMDYLSTIMVHADNSGSTPRHVLKFCTVKGTKRQINILFPPKKSCLGLLDHFGQMNYVRSKIHASSWLWICSKDLTRSKRYMKIILLYAQKILFVVLSFYSFYIHGFLIFISYIFLLAFFLVLKFGVFCYFVSVLTQGK